MVVAVLDFCGPASLFLCAGCSSHSTECLSREIIRLESRAMVAHNTKETEVAENKLHTIYEGRVRAVFLPGCLQRGVHANEFLLWVIRADALALIDAKFMMGLTRITSAITLTTYVEQLRVFQSNFDSAVFTARLTEI